MRGALKEPFSQTRQIEIILGLEPAFTKPVLLGVMLAAKADAPPVGWLQACAAFRARPDMGAFDRKFLAAGDTAVVFSDPSAVRWT